MIAAANPLRGLASDAAAVGDLLRSVDGPVVLVAHSYGGARAADGRDPRRVACGPRLAVPGRGPTCVCTNRETTAGDAPSRAGAIP